MNKIRKLFVLIVLVFASAYAHLAYANSDDWGTTSSTSSAYAKPRGSWETSTSESGWAQTTNSGWETTTPAPVYRQSSPVTPPVSIKCPEGTARVNGVCIPGVWVNPINGDPKNPKCPIGAHRVEESSMAAVAPAVTLAVTKKVCFVPSGK